MQCDKCGIKYYSKQCQKCNNISKKNNHNEENIFKTSTKKIITDEILITKTKFRKKINIPIIVIVSAVTIIAIILIKREYVEYQQNKQIAKMFYGTDDFDEIEEINKKLMIQNEKAMKQLRKLYIPE